MLHDIDNRYKDKIAIVAIGYSRLDGLRRLLDSCNRASYAVEDVPLVISIDASGNKEVYDYARNFQWNHGVKYVNIEKKRLGLKKHILQCGDLTRHFKGVILLEDDLYVSPDFYNYACISMNKYGDDENVAGIAFYSNEFNGFLGIPFHPLNNGSDCFAMQAVCSWGEMWNNRMWTEFTSWLNNWNEDYSNFDMPDIIKNWTRAWSKYFYAYLLANHKYFIYPSTSLTTNFNDGAGEHGSTSSPIVQVHLQYGKKDYRLFDFSDLEKYDIYQQNIKLYNKLGLSKNELSLDLYGQRLMEGKTAKYILTTQKLNFKIVQSFGLTMRPIELNILENIPGKGIFLYEANCKVCQWKYSQPLMDYMLAWYNRKYLCKYSVKYFSTRIKNKIWKR